MEHILDYPPVLTLPEVDSTNTYMAAHAGDFSHGDVVMTLNQTGGRGQRGNTWESAPGLNVTMSMMLRPEGLSARQQFAISEAVATAIADVTRSLVGPAAEVTVKWPNDIYAGDLKICGILIENVLCGSRIERSIAGIGLNVNQERFVSPAPNPVSVRMLTGIAHSVSETVGRLREAVLDNMRLTKSDEGLAELHSRYMSMLWRRHGYHPYRDAATGISFMAAIESIDPMGFLTLALPDGTVRRYAFKEVAAVL